MVNINKLRAKIVENGMTQSQVAKEVLCMSEATFSRKLRRGSFGLDEANKMIKALKIENPVEIFFADSVT